MYFLCIFKLPHPHITANLQAMSQALFVSKLDASGASEKYKHKDTQNYLHSSLDPSSSISKSYSYRYIITANSSIL